MGSQSLPLTSFVGAKLLRLIDSGNSHQPPLTATLQPNAVRIQKGLNNDLVNVLMSSWIHWTTDDSPIWIAKPPKYRETESPNNQSIKTLIIQHFGALLIQYINTLTTHCLAALMIQRLDMWPLKWLYEQSYNYFLCRMEKQWTKHQLNLLRLVKKTVESLSLRYSTALYIDERRT